MKVKSETAEPAEKVQIDGVNFKRDEIKSLVSSLKEVDHKLDQAFDNFSMLNNRFQESLENLELISSFMHRGFIESPEIIPNDLPVDQDDELEAMKILYTMDKKEQLFFQYILSKKTFSFLLSEDIIYVLGKKFEADKISLYDSIVKKLGTKSHDELIKKGKRLLEIVDDYSYSVYSGGLTKDYVEKIIEDLAKENSLVA